MKKVGYEVEWVSEVFDEDDFISVFDGVDLLGIRLCICVICWVVEVCGDKFYVVGVFCIGIN